MREILNSLTKITKSNLSSNQLTDPVLTPSLHVVNQKELDKLYENDIEHDFLKKIKGSSWYKFSKMKEIIKVKNKIKKKLKSSPKTIEVSW